MDMEASDSTAGDSTLEFAQGMLDFFAKPVGAVIGLFGGADGYGQVEGFEVQKRAEYVQRVLEFCESGEGLDLYQKVAFEAKTSDDATLRERVPYYMLVFQAFITACCQISGILFIIVDVCKHGMILRAKHQGVDYAEYGWADVCDIHSFDHFEGTAFEMKLLALFFSIFLGFYCYNGMKSVATGMYDGIRYAEGFNFINIHWLRAGLVINMLCYSVATYGSFLMVFFAPDSISLVLDAAALFFIVELDNMFTASSDYANIHENISTKLAFWGKGVEDTDQSGSDDEEMKEKEAKRAKARGDVAAYAEAKAGACCTKIVRFLTKIYNHTHKAMTCLSLVCCVVMPFFIVICK